MFHSAQKVLSVDGDLLARRVHRDVLDSIGLHVREVDSGVAAVAAVREEPPDLIVLGAQLEDVPGWQAAAWLHSIPALQSVPIILFGAQPAEDGGPASAAPHVLVLPRLASAKSLEEAVRDTLMMKTGDNQPGRTKTAGVPAQISAKA